ncbi:hypothetical protein NDU88_002099 [Pleurodeles waltl]|uniref:Uncharacterized protein n=1 Tax=Pleurodeles waltl TaxID=8319 RepID=A0AAV7TJS3_PLEWA|nr:hypothetical protein NDU88_002099 [Pleurodeles waltl]
MQGKRGSADEVAHVTMRQRLSFSARLLPECCAPKALFSQTLLSEPQERLLCPRGLDSFYSRPERLVCRAEFDVYFAPGGPL